MTEKAQRTIRIKWVRSGIGFGYHQKEMVRSLGLRRLNQVVERPDTPQVRGLVARIPHLVTIVAEPGKAAAWTSVPEYTIRPPEVAAIAPPAPPVETAVLEEASASAQEPVAEPVVTETTVKPPEAPPAPVKAAKGKKPAKPAAIARKGKAAETKKGKPATAKGAKPSKASKK